MTTTNTNIHPTFEARSSSCGKHRRQLNKVLEVILPLWYEQLAPIAHEVHGLLKQFGKSVWVGATEPVEGNLSFFSVKGRVEDVDVTIAIIPTFLHHGWMTRHGSSNVYGPEHKEEMRKHNFLAYLHLSDTIDKIGGVSQVILGAARSLVESGGKFDPATFRLPSHCNVYAFVSSEVAIDNYDEIESALEGLLVWEAGDSLPTNIEVKGRTVSEALGFALGHLLKLVAPA